MKSLTKAILFGCLAFVLFLGALASLDTNLPIWVSVLVLLFAMVCVNAMFWAYEKPESRKTNEKHKVQEHDLLEVEARRAFENWRH